MSSSSQSMEAHGTKWKAVLVNTSPTSIPAHACLLQNPYQLVLWTFLIRSLDPFQRLNTPIQEWQTNTPHYWHVSRVQTIEEQSGNTWSFQGWAKSCKLRMNVLTKYPKAPDSKASYVLVIVQCEFLFYTLFARFLEVTYQSMNARRKTKKKESLKECNGNTKARGMQEKWKQKRGQKGK